MLIANHRFDCPTLNNKLWWLDLLQHLPGVTTSRSSDIEVEISSTGSDHPPRHRNVKVNGNRCLLEAMHSYGCHTLVFSNSATLYGYPEAVPITPINHYGHTKAALKQMLSDQHASAPDAWRIERGLEDMCRDDWTWKQQNPGGICVSQPKACPLDLGLCPPNP